MASKRHVLQRRQCKNKVPYETAERATQVMERRIAMGTIKGEMNVYPCRFCGKFHMGHVSAKVRREIERRRERDAAKGFSA